MWIILGPPTAEQSAAFITRVVNTMRRLGVGGRAVVTDKRPRVRRDRVPCPPRGAVHRPRGHLAPLPEPQRCGRTLPRHRPGRVLAFHRRRFTTVRQLQAAADAWLITYNVGSSFFWQEWVLFWLRSLCTRCREPEERSVKSRRFRKLAGPSPERRAEHLVVGLNHIANHARDANLAVCADAEARWAARLVENQAREEAGGSFCSWTSCATPQFSLGLVGALGPRLRASPKLLYAQMADYSIAFAC
jgi:hypothetical protein